MSFTIMVTVVSLLALALLSLRQGIKIKKLTAQTQGTHAPTPAEVAELAQLRQEVEKLKSISTSSSATALLTAPSPTSSDAPILPEIQAPHGGTLIKNAALENSSRISTDHPTFIFANHRWRVKLNILYTLQDGGFQQGRFVLLARGPGMLQAFPKRAAQFAEPNQPLIDLGKGETFSVARFREIKTEFHAPEGRETLKEIQLLVIDPEGKLLMNKIIPLQTQSL